MKRPKYLLSVALGILILASAVIFHGKSKPASNTHTLVRQASGGTTAMPAKSSLGRTNSAASQPRIMEAYGRLPMAFEANQGQTDHRVKFLSRGSGYSIFLTANEAVIALHENSWDHAAQAPASTESGNLKALGVAGLRVSGNPESRAGQLVARESSTPAVLRMKLVGVKGTAKVSGMKELPGRSNYFIGNDRKKWHTQVPNYAEVKYHNAYRGIDLIYYGHQGQLEYDFVLAPGASPKTIKLSISGISHDAHLRINGEGNLIVGLDNEEVSFHKPVVYQQVGATRNYVDGRYVQQGAHEIGFEVPSYDRSKALVIDPTLSYSTYLGGSKWDFGHGIAVDASGNAYVTGYTQSTDFPTSNPLQPTNHGGSSDVFIAALDPTGSTLLYSTYLGGSDDDIGYGIAVDSSGDAYVTGYTASTNFPTLNPLQPTNHGRWDAFVAALDPTGSTLIYSTYLGGSGIDVAYGIAVDGSGDVYVTGDTSSFDFPTANPLQPTKGGSDDAFVAALDPTGSILLYSTYLGGSGADAGHGVAVDGSGDAYVTGFTQSTNFPIWNPLQPTNHGNVNAFVAVFDPSGSTLIYSTYLGGSSYDQGFGIAVDSAGDAYLTGATISVDFPTWNPLQPTYHGGAGSPNAFVTALDPTGSTLLYSTYLGGSNSDAGYGITVDGAGNAYVTGYTGSFDFPTANPLQSMNRAYPNSNAFVTAVDPTGSTLLYSTYLGGSGADGGHGVAVDSFGDVYVIGYTFSNNFPTSNPLQPTNHGGYDAFVLKIAP